MATSSSDGLDMDEDAHSPDAKHGKTKKFQPFKKMKRFFSSRKRTKSKEDEGGTSVHLKSKSTTDVLRLSKTDDTEEEEDDELVQLASNKTLSMSADSVFSPDRPKDTNIEELKASARSMEQLHQPAFTNELFQKLKSRRAEDDDDPGLPSSPVTQPSTHDVLNDFKKPNRHESKHSVTSDMNSSDDELEEKDVFRVNWADVVPNPKGPASRATDSGDDLDLDLVSSTTSLSNTGAKHKISVRPQRTRPSAQHRRPAKASATVGATKALPQVQEEQLAHLAGEVEEEGDLGETEQISGGEDRKHDDETKPEAKVEVRVEASIQPDAEPKASSDLEADVEEAVSTPEETQPEAPLSIVIPKSELRSSPSPVPKSPKALEKKTPELERKEVKIEVEPVHVEAEKKEVEQEKTEPKTTTREEPREATPFKVVLRDTGRRKDIEEAGTLRRRENVVDKDPSKRQTIAGDSSLAIFGERKAGNRSSFVEVRRSQEVKEETENEFSQVLNRLKKQSSRKKLIPDSSTDIKPDKSKPTTAAVVDPKPKVVEVIPRSVEAKPKVPEVKPKVIEIRSKVTETKPKVTESKSDDTELKPKIADVKPKASEVKPKVTEVRTKVTEVKPKVIETKPMIAEAKPSETLTKPLNPSRVEKDVIVKEKETVILAKTATVSKSRNPEVRPVKVQASAPQSKTDDTKPLHTLDSKSESRPDIGAKSESKPAKLESKQQPTSPPKTMIIEKPKLNVEPKKVIIEKGPSTKTPTKEEAGKSDESQQFKRETPLQKNRLRSQTVGDQPVDNANKENETAGKLARRSNSQSDAVEERPSDSETKPVSRNGSNRVAGNEGTSGSEPAWFALARRKTTNWDRKEKELEQKEKKETSNIAEKERDAEKSKEVTLTIDDAAKEDSKPALRAVGKCSNSAASRQSKVLDMAKLFQNQVS